LKSGVVVTGSNVWNLSQGKNPVTRQSTQGFDRSPVSGGFSHFVGNVRKFIDATDYPEIASVVFPVGTLPTSRACYRPLSFAFTQGAGSAPFNLTVSHEDTRPGHMNGLPIQTSSIVISNYADFYWDVHSDISLTPSQQFDLEAQAQGYTGYMMDGIQNVRLLRRDKPEMVSSAVFLVKGWQNGAVYDNSVLAADWPIVKSISCSGGITTSGAIFTLSRTNGGPFVTTGASSNLTSTSATLDAQVYALVGGAKAWFEWGTGGTLASYNTTATQPIDTVSPTKISVDLKDLSPGTKYYWRAVAQGAGEVQRSLIFNFTTNPLSGVEHLDGALPNDYALNQNYPNPFNPSTAIRFQLSAVSFVRLIVCDVLGREVAVLVDEEKQPGNYSVSWDASKFPGGTYFYRLQARQTDGARAGDASTGSARGFVQTRKMIFMK
jgi:hypothetical protein